MPTLSVIHHQSIYLKTIRPPLTISDYLSWLFAGVGLIIWTIQYSTDMRHYRTVMYAFNHNQAKPWQITMTPLHYTKKGKAFYQIPYKNKFLNITVDKPDLLFVVTTHEKQPATVIAIRPKNSDIKIPISQNLREIGGLSDQEKRLLKAKIYRLLNEYSLKYKSIKENP